jgi:hypothetical protein
VIVGAVCSGDVCQVSGVDVVIVVIVVVLIAAGLVRGVIFLSRRGRPSTPDPQVLKARELEGVTGSTRIESVKSSEVEAARRLYQDHGWEVVQQSTAKSFGSKARVTITFRKP